MAHRYFAMCNYSHRLTLLVWAIDVSQLTNNLEATFVRSLTPGNVAVVVVTALLTDGRLV